ncbi:Hypothetical predicted protein [Pelobates cultripes]|uniref:ZP domain-containing protein n=1 Tax=Pelobates cultripes TaxID=61616 RepID=A0AAD1VKY6_PELCU|nr:Hypothetical predicted protein [Pelobates cultripes]
MLLLSSFVLLALLGFAGSSSSCYAGIDGNFIMCSNCGGSCNATSGCKCVNQTSCIPETGSCNLNSSACCLAGFSWNPDLACCIEGPYCNPQCLIDENCTFVNQTSTCTVNTAFYQNKNLSINNITTSVTCKGGNMTASVNKNILDFLHYTPINASLSDPTCTKFNVSIVDGVRIYSVTVSGRVGTCGNSMQKTTDQVTYTNTLHISKYSASGIVSSSNISVQFSCTYNLTMQTSLSTVFKPVMSSQNLDTESSSGDSTTTIAAYENPSYTQPILQQNQQELSVGSTLYFGMTTQFPDPVFVLRVETCFSTPTSDGSGQIKVILIQNGCPTNEGPYIEVEENGKSKEVRFSITSYAFPGYNNVFIFCDARLCNTASESCATCGSSRDQSGIPRLTQFSLGPFQFIDTENSCSHIALSVAVLLGSLLTLWIL